MARKPKTEVVSVVAQDDWFVLDIDAMFEAYMKGNQKTWEHDRTKSVGASEIFSCMRQTFFKKRGKEFGYLPDDDYVERWGATERGNIIEAHFVAPALTTQCPDGVELLFAGSDQITLIEGRNSATPDGLFTGLPEKPLRIIAGGRTIEVKDFKAKSLGLEIKSIDPRAHLEEERIKHRGQSIVGMGMLREKTEFQPTHWLILYFDASWLDNIKPFLIEYDHSVYLAAKKRAPLIWEHDNPNAFDPEGKYAGECDHCMFRQACGEAVLSEWKNLSDKPAAAPEIVEAVTDVVQAFLDAKELLEFATTDVEQKKQAVKDRLIEVGHKKVHSDSWNVSWSTQKGRKSTDYKRAIEDHGIDLEPYITVGPGIDTLRVTRKDQSEGFENEH